MGGGNGGANSLCRIAEREAELGTLVAGLDVLVSRRDHVWRNPKQHELLNVPFGGEALEQRDLVEGVYDDASDTHVERESQFGRGLVVAAVISHPTDTVVQEMFPAAKGTAETDAKMSRMTASKRY